MPKIIALCQARIKRKALAALERGDLPTYRASLSQLAALAREFEE